MSTLIKNGRIVTAVDDYNADIFIEDEKITQIGKNLEMGADKVIDASNRLVIPGGIDPHTHFDMPFGGTMSADDFESGPTRNHRHSWFRRKAYRNAYGDRFPRESPGD